MRHKDNIKAVDLAETGLLPYKNKIVKYLLCAIDFFSKCALVKTLKGEKR